MNNHFGKIGVLMGGLSSEREISLKSGKAVFLALIECGQNAEAIDITTDDRSKNIDLIKSGDIDCVFLALHGRYGEDGAIQEILEELGIVYTGSGVSASRLAIDKIASRVIFEQAGLKVPRYKILEKGQQSSLRSLATKGGGRSNLKSGIASVPLASLVVPRNDNLEIPLDEDMVFPLVVKPATNGSSIGLSIVDDEAALDEAVQIAFGFDPRILIEEFVPGREVTVGILDREPLPVIEVIPKKRFFDYEAKYQSGLTEYIVPAELEASVARLAQDAAQRAHNLLGCSGCSRVDIILDKESVPCILEVNTIPGFTATSLLPKAARAAGIGFGQLCMRLIELAYEKTKTEFNRRPSGEKA
ncbi:MAG: D-alanine--D-alanine ligase [Candidatus Omnitrophica bacterium]|nr:D-alanine--D-alanine ligase [Candidatus Omnitrophota bacterium]